MDKLACRQDGAKHQYGLDYLRESAFGAPASRTLNYYQQIQQAWLVHVTDINYLRPLVCTDRVIVEKWVLLFHQFSFDGDDRRASKANSAQSPKPQ